MKFLCVPCDKAMKLERRSMPEPGSLSLVYECEDCGYEMAMLTNAHETQAVSSLGVEFGGKADVPKCPVTGMLQEMSASSSGAEFPWTPEAEERMANVPDFVRPMIRGGIEKFARDRGYDRVDERVLEEARGSFGM